MRMHLRMTTIAALLAPIWIVPTAATAQRALLPIDFVNSAEHGWLAKRVEASRMLDDMTQPSTWRMTGTGTLSFPNEPRLGDMRALRVDMQMFRDTPAPNRARFSSINLQRAFPNEDWTQYNRLSLWVRPDFSGIPVLPLQIVLHSDGKEKVPDRFNREGTHYITTWPSSLDAWSCNGWRPTTTPDGAFRRDVLHSAIVAICPEVQKPPSRTTRQPNNSKSYA